MPRMNDLSANAQHRPFLRLPSVIDGENCVFRTYRLPSSAHFVASPPPNQATKRTQSLFRLFFLSNCIPTCFAFELLSIAILRQFIDFTKIVCLCKHRRCQCKLSSSLPTATHSSWSQWSADTSLLGKLGLPLERSVDPVEKSRSCQLRQKTSCRHQAQSSACSRHKRLLLVYLSRISYSGQTAF